MKYSKKRIQKIQKKSQQKNRKNRRNTKNVRNRRLNNKSIKYGGMESAPQPHFLLGTTLSKELKLPLSTDEHTICIDIQGITATPKSLKTGFLGLAYSEIGPTFFNNTAPQKIANYLDRYQNIYIIWQGDKDFDKNVKNALYCDIHTGIGNTISRLYNKLKSQDKSVEIICISNQDECEQVEDRLSQSKIKKHELIDTNICSKINPDYEIWRKELINYYGEGITKWEKWNGSGRKNKTTGEININDRIENLIKQYISNLLSNTTFILNYGHEDSISSSISPHFNKEKHEAGNVIHISP